MTVVALVVPLLAVAVLALWGRWRMESRGLLAVEIRSPGSQTYGERVLAATVVARDAQGSVLARGASDDLFGVVRFRHPQVGDCLREEGEAQWSEEAFDRWRGCRETQLAWSAQWAPRVTALDIDAAGCHAAQVQVRPRRRDGDWLFWWVRVPGSGDGNYVTWAVTVTLDASTCSAVAG